MAHTVGKPSLSSIVLLGAGLAVAQRSWSLSHLWETGRNPSAADRLTDLPEMGRSVRPLQAFERALATVREMRGDLVATDGAAGRIEATDTTFRYGFKDDVVIRVRPAHGGSR